jgi:hypothetical protein
MKETEQLEDGGRTTIYECACIPYYGIFHNEVDAQNE